MEFKYYLKTIVPLAFVILGLSFSSQLYTAVPHDPEDTTVCNVRKFGSPVYNVINNAILDLFEPTTGMQPSFIRGLRNIFLKEAVDGSWLQKIETYVKAFFAQGAAITELRKLIADTSVKFLRYDPASGSGRQQLIPAPQAAQTNGILRTRPITPAGDDINAVWGERAPVVHYMLLDAFLYRFVQFMSEPQDHAPDVMKILCSDAHASTNRKKLLDIIKDSITRERAQGQSDSFVDQSYWGDLEKWFTASCSKDRILTTKPVSPAALRTLVATLPAVNGLQTEKTRGCCSPSLQGVFNSMYILCGALAALYCGLHAVANEEMIDPGAKTPREFSIKIAKIAVLFAIVNVVLLVGKRCLCHKRLDAKPAQ